MNSNTYQYINLELIYDMADGEDEFVVEIINDYFSSTANSLDHLQKAIHSEDQSNILFFAHKLKGTLKFIGADAIAEIMARIEQHCNGGFDSSKIANLFHQAAQQLSKVEAELNEVVNSIEVK